MHFSIPSFLLYSHLPRTAPCLFFFSCSVHHRDLHSFPTRRSSDLGDELRVARPLGLGQRSTGEIEVVDAVLGDRSEEHTSELQSRPHLVCRLLLEKKKKENTILPTKVMPMKH